MEELLQYSFRDRRLLAEAFTHCSWPDRALPCYQRLEFLGDAVLDLLITRHYALAWCANPTSIMSCMPCKHSALAHGDGDVVLFWHEKAEGMP